MTDYRYLSGRLPADCQRYLPALLAGNPRAAMLTVSRMGVAAALGLCLELLESGRAPTPCGAIFQALWVKNNPRVIREVASRERLARLCGFAGLPALDEARRLWRGSSADSAAEVAAGWCWTDSYPTACFFAVRASGLYRKPPRVVAAEFPEGSAVRLPETADSLPAVAGEGAGEYIALKTPADFSEVGSPQTIALEGGLALVGALTRWPGLVAEEVGKLSREGLL